MTTLIFEPSVSGHHLEYLHHYYEGALERPNEQFVFLVTRKFEEVKDTFVWKEAENIIIRHIDQKFDKLLSAKNPYVLGWNTSKVLRHYVKKISPNRVLLTMLMQFIPFICFLLPGTIKVRGIMYKVFLYDKDRMSRLRLLAEELRFREASRSKVIETIFVLNDAESAEKLNTIYKTDKFKFIPDPVPDADLSICRNLRSELMIPERNKVFLHFGAMDERKGTLDILEAIQLTDAKDLEDKTFIFAGKICDDLNGPFYSLLVAVKDKANVIVFDKFCGYDFLYNLCYTCDVILMPYHVTSLSSGCLGYGAVFKKPVIGPNGGLIGHLIDKYGLGETLADTSAKSIKESFNKDTRTCQSEYAKINQKTHFINSIIY